MGSGRHWASSGQFTVREAEGQDWTAVVARAIADADGATEEGSREVEGRKQPSPFTDARGAGEIGQDAASRTAGTSRRWWRR